MDQELAGKQQVIPTPPPPPSAGFQFTEMRGSAFVVKKADDNPSKADLENAPVNREFAKIRAFELTGAGILFPLTEGLCRSNLLNIISVDGASGSMRTCKRKSDTISIGKPGTFPRSPPVITP